MTVPCCHTSLPVNQGAGTIPHFTLGLSFPRMCKERERDARVCCKESEVASELGSSWTSVYPSIPKNPREEEEGICKDQEPASELQDPQPSA